MKPLTDRQREVLRMIVEITDQLGYPPSFRELATALGVGVPRVHQMIDRLRYKGRLVENTPGRARDIVLSRDAWLDLDYPPRAQEPKTIGECFSAIRCSHCNVTRIGAGICPGCRGRIAA
jgi:SOS-response transcriptional repressor LexA